MNPDDYKSAFLKALGMSPEEDPKKAPPPPPPSPLYMAAMGRALSPRDDAAVRPSPGVQMMQTGITPQQRGGYMPGLSEGLFKYITPSNYMEAEGAKTRVLQDAKSMVGLGPAAPARQQLPAPQEDSWRLYLGMPEKSREFEAAPFTPTTAKGDGAQYLRIQQFLPRYVAHMAMQTNTPPEVVLRELVDDAKRSGGRLPMSDNDFSLDATKPNGMYGVMQNFQVSHGHDEVGPYLSYYDKWDLHAPGADHVGKPYDLYDRMYYDPATFKQIPQATVLAKKSGLNLAPAQP